MKQTEVDWSKFPKATQEKVKMEKLHNKIINGFQEEHKQDRTCTNNCSVVCGECQIFKPKQETLEQAKAKLFRYSEEEVRKIALDFFYYWWNSKGNNTEQGFDKWFELNKKK